MNRKYQVKVQLAPHLASETPKESTIEGSFSYGSFDAAEAYAARYLPDYQVIPGGQYYNPTLRKFEAINHKIGYGAVIWVTEV